MIERRNVGEFDEVRAVAGPLRIDLFIDPATPELHDELSETDETQALSILDADGKMYAVRRIALRAL